MQPMSHTSVTFFQATGFNSCLRDFAVSSRLAAISSRCKGKRVVEYMYMQSL